MPFSSWLFRCTTIQFPATPLRCFSMHIHCCSSRLFSLTSLFNAIRIVTTHFQYDAVLRYSIAFHSHSLAHLLRTTPFLHISILFYCKSAAYYSCAYLLCTFLWLCVSCLFSAGQCPCVSFPDLSLLFLCLSALHVSTAVQIVASQCLRITFLCQA